MNPEGKFLLFYVLTCLFCMPLSAQDKSARERLFAAHAMYYTPTASGLTSFYCDTTIDWKATLTRIAGKEIPDDNPTLKFLQTVHLSVADDLKDKGSLGWTVASDPPEGKENAIKQMREGLQTSVEGFFQSWNAYMNGSMVPLPDSTVTVTKSGDGVHLSGESKDMKFDEDFDKNMLLTQALVVGPNLRVLATPTFQRTPDGLVVSAVTSQMNQPPTAPQTEATFRIDYATVDSFQIPSHIALNVKNTASFEFNFSACQVSIAEWAKTPQRH
jgi:hypothetical protein